VQNGDLSNESSPRIIVIIDVVAKSELEENKGFLNRSMKRTGIVPNSLPLSRLWNIANQYGLSVELAAFKSELWTQPDLDSFMERLERRGGNPFNYAELYNDIEDFISDLPYRNNLKGVVDLRERVARYGSWGIEIDNL
jgi:hypothetical protein